MYVLDEEKVIINGTWEGYLDHEDVNQGSIMIFTGKKLTGERLTVYSVVSSIGKTKIRVNGMNGSIYITYETSAVPVTTTSKEEGISEIPTESEKADKVYVDMELQKKADKITTFTKQEVLQKIEENGGNLSVIDGGSFI